MQIPPHLAGIYFIGVLRVVTREKYLFCIEGDVYFLNSSDLITAQQGKVQYLQVSRSLGLAQSVVLLPFWPLLFCWI